MRTHKAFSLFTTLNLKIMNNFIFKFITKRTNFFIGKRKKVFNFLVMTKMVLEVLNLLRSTLKMVLTIKLQPIPHFM